MKIPVVIALIGLGVAFGASPFTLSVRPLYQNDRSGGMKPLALTILNSGREANGVVHVGTYSSSVDYPVDIPAESTKTLVVYAGSAYGPAFDAITLDADTGSAAVRFFDNNTDVSVPNVLVIGDDPGSFSWLESQNNRSAGGIARPLNDIYCLPQDAQPRVLAYDEAAEVILGPGAEQMSDAAVQALKQYALEGGTLVFFGGTSARSLEDPRWQDDLPATNFVETTVSGTDGLEELGSEPLDGPVTLWEPKAVRGAAVKRDGDKILTVEAGYGFGHILCIAFDPMDAKLSSWAGRWSATYNALKQGLYANRLTSLSSFATRSPDLVNDKPDPKNDPFGAKLPPVGQVFGILAAYFIAVLPLNFLALRKIRKAELAWFTAPILSLGFASILFRSAGSLYGDSISTATKGVLVVRSGSPDGLFVGNTAMFLPAGGHYDLKTQGLDSIGPIFEPDLQNNSPQYGIDDEQYLPAVDTGEEDVSNLSVGNLAFRQMTYTQRLSLSSDYSVSMHPEGHSAICTVTNGSDEPLTDARAVVGNHVSTPQEIPAHSTRTFAVDMSKSPDANQPRSVVGLDGVRMALASNNGAALEATMSGFRPGPQIGEQIDARTQITLLVFSKDALGGHK